MNFADARRGCFLYGIYSRFVTSAIIRKSREKFDLVNFSVSCRREARSGRQDAFFFDNFVSPSLTWSAGRNARSRGGGLGGRN